MKNKLSVYILFISLLLQISKASVVTDGCDGLCYDSSLAINVGDKLNWVVIENLENGIPVEYGLESEGPLVISMEVIREIKGIPEFNVILFWDDYFKTNLTVAGKNIDGDLDDFINLFPNTGYYWIEPTHLINESVVVNRFIDAVENISNSSIFIEGVLWNMTQQRFHSIDNYNYYLNYNLKLIRNNDSAIVYTETREMSFSIQTGQLLHVAYSLEDIKRESVEDWNIYSYVVNAETFIVTETNTELINYPFIAMMVPGVLIVRSFYYTYFRKP